MEISIKEVAAKAGGVVALSKALGLSRGAVSQWSRVPVERVVAVERLTGISRAVLRPDVFGISSDCRCAEPKEAAYGAKVFKA